MIKIFGRFQCFQKRMNKLYPIIQSNLILFSSSSSSQQAKSTKIRVLNQEQAKIELKDVYSSDLQLKDILEAKYTWKYLQDQKNKSLYLISTKPKEEEQEAGKGQNSSKPQRGLGVQAANLVNSAKYSQVEVQFSNGINQEGRKQFINSFILSTYDGQRKTSQKDQKTLKDISFKSQKLSDKQNFSKVSAQATNYARLILNKTGGQINPTTFSDQVHKLLKAESSRVQIHQVVGQDLQKGGMNCHYAVGKGASTPPRMILVHYKGDPSSEKVHAIIGKGVTFDTGGINLKPTNYIEDMYLDKGGACATLGALKGCIDLNLKVNVVFGFSLAQNAIDANSFLPSEVLTSLKGKTVQIGNTDAEGRLCLIDTFTYVQRKFKIDKMIDLATLTGACPIALGTQTAGLFSNDQDFAKEIIQLGKQVNESHWHLPINEQHHQKIKGKVADLSNSGGRYGGSSQAAAFLENFVQEGTKWVHLDIAGPAAMKQPKLPTFCFGGTGFGTQTLLNFLMNESK